jgi:hypothetical protein
MIDMIKEAEFTHNGKGQSTVFSIGKIKNGSKFIVGGKLSRVELTLHQHFNWLQKLMWKWCFGVKVEDYNEE